MRLEGNRLHAAGELSNVLPRRLSISAELAGAPLGRLYHLLKGGGVLTAGDTRIRDLLAGLTLDATASLWTDFDRMVVTSPRLTVSARDDPQTRLSSAFTMDRGNVYLSGFTGTWRGLSIGGDASVTVGADGSARFAADARFKDIPYTITGTWSTRDGLFVEGSYGLSLALVTAADGTWTVRARASVCRCRPPTGSGTPPSTPRGRWTRRASWRFAGTLLVPDLDAVPSAPGSLEAAFDATPQRITLRRMRYADGISVLEGGGTVDFRTQFDPLVSGLPRGARRRVPLDVKAVGARGNLPGRWHDPRPERSTRGSTFASSPLKRLGSMALRGEVSGTAHDRGTVRVARGEREPLAGERHARHRPDQRRRRRCSWPIGDSRSPTSSVSYLDHRVTAWHDKPRPRFRDAGGLGALPGDVLRRRGRRGRRAAGDAGRRRDGRAGPFGTPLGGPALARLDPRRGSSRRAVGSEPPHGRRSPVPRRRSGRFAARARSTPTRGGSWSRGSPLPVTGRAAGRFVGTRLEADVEVTSFDAADDQSR